MKAESHDESHGSHDEGDSPAPPSGGNINLETHNIPATLPSTISMDAQQQLAQARLNALSRIIEFRTRNVSTGWQFHNGRFKLIFPISITLKMSL